MGIVRLTERFAFTGGKVDRTGPYPVVKGVLLCGPSSANRRRYKPAAFGPADRKLYEGKPVFIDHGDARTPRSYRDKIGSIENEGRRADGMPVGDIAVNPKHPLAEQFLFDAEHKPGSCGMSHVAACETAAGADGWDEVEKVAEVESADVVVGPATTKGLYEHTGGRAVPFTFKQLVEWVTKHPKSTTKQITKAKRLAEMDGMGDAPALPADPAPDADPDEAISAGFKTAIMAVVEKAMSGDMDPKAALSKIKTLLNSHGDATAAADGGDADPDPEPTPEGRRAKPPTIGDLLAEASANGIKAPTVGDLTVLIDLPTPAARKRYCETVLARAGESPTSAGRRPGDRDTGKPADRTAEGTAPPTDGKAFGRWVQE